jgi:hypothetical protein
LAAREVCRSKIKTMSKQTIQARLRAIAKESRPCEKDLLLAALVIELFRERGYEMVVVGGSAIEFYTDGNYLSGDVDLCWLSSKRPSPRECQEIMGQLGGKGGPRSWKVAGLFVDTLGIVETDAKTSFRECSTPFGTIRLAKIEDLIVERILMASYPQPNREAKDCASKLLAVCLDDKNPFKVDWKEIERLARSPTYRVSAELAAMKKEVSKKLR